MESRQRTISAATLIGLHYPVAYLTFKSKKVERWIEGIPTRQGRRRGSWGAQPIHQHPRNFVMVDLFER